MQQGTDNLNTLTNIVYVLTDVLETNLMDMQEAFKKQGCALRHDVKRNYNTAIHAIRCIKRDIAHLESSTQENFGHDADITNALLLTLIDTGAVTMMSLHSDSTTTSSPFLLNLGLGLKWTMLLIF